jgi:hypothetical protein
VLVDKVYTFFTGRHTLNLTDIYFEKGINYNLRVGVVTDSHKCHMEILLIDPENDIYQLYTTNTTDGSRLCLNDYREIPFGTALNGSYTLNFTKLDGPAMNIHIQVLEGESCVQKITDPSCVIRTEIEKFSKRTDGNDDVVYHYLESQWKYRIFITRISSVRGDQPINISIEHSVRDDSESPTWFEISLPPYLGEVYSALSYSFGTATDGEYRFSTTYQLPMDHTNILFIIADQGPIAGGDEPEPDPPDNSTQPDPDPTDNSTTPDPPDNSSQPDPDPSPQFIVSVPMEAQLGIGLGVGIVVLLGALLIGYAKLKHAI